MTEPHWNETDPADDVAFPAVEAVPSGETDDFPEGWGEVPTPRDEAVDLEAEDAALYQQLLQDGWVPPPGWGQPVSPVDDGDPATAQIDTTPPPPGGAHRLMEDDGAGVDLPIWSG